NAAKKAGGGRVAVWRPGSDAEEANNLDRLTGLFTANLAKDYRNMALLWDTVTVVAASTDSTKLGMEVVGRLFRAFKCDRVGLLRCAEAGRLQLVHAVERRSDGESRPVRD